MTWKGRSLLAAVGVGVGVMACAPSPVPIAPVRSFEREAAPAVEFERIERRQDRFVRIPVPPPPEAGPVPQHEPAPALRLRSGSCEDYRIEDNGHVVYVVLGRDCPEPVDGEWEVAVVDENTDSELSVQPLTGVGASLAFGTEWSRTIELVRAGQWRHFPNEGTWAPRDGAGLVELNGVVYLLGGWIFGPVTSEVWRSVDLHTWEYLGDAPWAPRHGAGWIVFNNRMWVVGGDMLEDVWSSADGITWVQETEQAPFGRRYAPTVAATSGFMLVFGGTVFNDFSDGFPDIWRSADGRNWELATDTPPFEPRGLIHGQAVLDDEIFLIGGGHKAIPPGGRYSETIAEFTDIWSTRDGANWDLRTERFSFLPRTHFSVASAPHGCFVSDGSVGTQVNVSNELLFAPDCVSFEPIPDPLPLQPRHASSVLYWNGSVVVLGGPPVGNALTSVWQYFPD